MRKIVGKTLALAALALISGSAAAGIENTKHNLSSTNNIGTVGTDVANKTTNTDQICVFCHTPHGANTDAPAPLWNKALPSTTYTTYATMNSSTIDGQILAVGSVSLACLSCHDGSQAMDNMFNAPGSGAGAGTGAAGVSQNYTWTGSGQTSGKITGIANLEGDLKNDHPIGIEYCGGGITGADATVSGTCADLDFKGASDIKTKKVNNQQVFWIDRGTSAGVRDKEDIILYTRAFDGGDGPSVECASCHDPHVETKNTDNVNFMRVTTKNSDICLACHTK